MILAAIMMVTMIPIDKKTTTTAMEIAIVFDVMCWLIIGLEVMGNPSLKTCVNSTGGRGTVVESSSEFGLKFEFESELGVGVDIGLGVGIGS